MLLLVIVAASITLSLALVVSRSYHLLIGIIVAGGWAQSPLISLTHSSEFQYIDDMPAAILVGAAVVSSMTRKDKNVHKALLLLILLVALTAIGVVRSPDIGVGIAQARQVLMPFGLVFAGFVYREDIKWPNVMGVVLFFAALTVAWVFVEEFMQTPLINPTWYYVDVIGGTPYSLRMGLPPSYFADGVDGGLPTFRPGGPFMNPPTMGFLLGLGAFAAVSRMRGFVRLAFLAATAAALMFSYARAGILVLLVVTVIYFIWVRVGKYAGVLVGLGMGAYMVSTFVEQGNTASHADGLLSGFMLGLKSPIGQGFGTTGYQALLEGAAGGAGGESLLGLYFAWMGWPMILAALVCLLRLWKLLRRTPKAESLTIWVAIAFLLTVASSESASSITSTPVLWLIGGSVLAMSVPPKPERVQTSRIHARTERQG